MNIEILKTIGKQFGITFGIMFSIIFLLHIIILLILSFIQMDSLVVSGLDVTSMTWFGRSVFVLFYLILPCFVAVLRVLNLVHAVCVSYMESTQEVHESINKKE